MQAYLRENLGKHKVERPSSTALLLLSHVLEKPKSWILAHTESELNENQINALKEQMKAIELLGRMCGDFVEKRVTQIEGKIQTESVRKEIREKLENPDIWTHVSQLGEELLDSAEKTTH